MIIKVIFWGIPVFLGLESHTESGKIQVISVRLVPPCFLAKTTSFMRSSDHNHFFPAKPQALLVKTHVFACLLHKPKFMVGSTHHLLGVTYHFFA